MKLLAVFFYVCASAFFIPFFSASFFDLVSLDHIDQATGFFTVSRDYSANCGWIFSVVIKTKIKDEKRILHVA